MSEIEPLMLQSTIVGSSGLLYYYGNAQAQVATAANEIGQAYARRQNAAQNQRRISNIEMLVNVLGLYASSMDLASAALSMPVPTNNRVTHRITFKNEADIILVPAQINMPEGYFYNTSPRILYPGDVCTCIVTHQAFRDSTARMSFSFSAISTDDTILPVDTPISQAGVFHFEVWIGRTGAPSLRATLSRVDGFVGNDHRVHTLEFGIGGNESESSMRYVGFRGMKGSTMPSFGITCVDVRRTSTQNQTMGTQITFTPLDLRY